MAQSAKRKGKRQMKLKWREYVASAFDAAGLLIRHGGYENTRTFLKVELVRVEKENELLKELSRTKLYSGECYYLLMDSDWGLRFLQTSREDRSAERGGGEMNQATELLIELMASMSCEHLDIMNVMSDFCPLRIISRHHYRHELYVCDECDDAELTKVMSPGVIRKIKEYLEGIEDRADVGVRSGILDGRGGYT